MELFVLILIPLAAALLMAFAPAPAARAISIIATLAALAYSIFVAMNFDLSENAPAYQLAKSIKWLPDLGVSLSVGADGVSMVLILLTTLLGPICVISSKTAIKSKVRTYYAWLLVLQAAMTGVFAARDLVLFYICFEFTLVPMFILISLYGSTNRKRAAVKFFLYTFTGSVIALAGLVYVAVDHQRMYGSWTFDISVLQVSARTMPIAAQNWVLIALLAGFAVKVPLFPLHTWLPLAHTEAPTAGSVVLAGVLLKLGTYAIFRFVLSFVPIALLDAVPVLAVLCIVGILYGGLICWVQTDVKKLVAYSSVAHLGFCMLGMFALNTTGVTGSVLYMINHGLSTGALFLLIGMVYERYHTRSMKELGGLAGKMPVWSTFMVFFVMASVGLPGLNGFVSEFLCMMGAFQASSAWGSGMWNSSGGVQVGATPGGLGGWFAIIAGAGVIVAAMYLLTMTGKVVWGVLVEPGGHSHSHGHGHSKGQSDAHAEGELSKDLNVREIGVLVPLAVLCVVLGVYPKPVIDFIERPVTETVVEIDKMRLFTEAFPGGRMKQRDGDLRITTPTNRSAPVQVPEKPDHDHDHGKEQH